MEVIKTNKLTWIDIKNPSVKDIDYLRKNFGFHEIFLEELLEPSLRPKADYEKNYIFTVLHFPVYNRKTRKISAGEVDFFITKNHLITIRYRTIEPFKTFFNFCKKKKGNRSRYMDDTPAHLFYFLVDKLFDECYPQIDHITKDIDNIENNIFKGREREMVHEISIIRRNVLNYIKILKPERTALTSLLEIGTDMFGGRELKKYFRDLMASWARIWMHIINHKEILDSVASTNESLLSYKLGEIMKILTVLSFITFPLSVIAGIFGMNVYGQIAWVNNPITPIIIIIIMFSSAFWMYLYFRKKKWL